METWLTVVDVTTLPEHPSSWELDVLLSQFQSCQDGPEKEELRKRLQAIIETIILFLLGPQFGVAGRDDVPSTSNPTGATGVSEMDVDVTSRGMVVGQLCCDPALFVELAKRLVKDEAARVKLKIEPLVTWEVFVKVVKFYLFASRITPPDQSSDKSKTVLRLMEAIYNGDDTVATNPTKKGIAEAVEMLIPALSPDGVEHESRPGVVDNVVRILCPEFVLT